MNNEQALNGLSRIHSLLAMHLHTLDMLDISRIAFVSDALETNSSIQLGKFHHTWIAADCLGIWSAITQRYNIQQTADIQSSGMVYVLL